MIPGQPGWWATVAVSANSSFNCDLSQKNKMERLERQLREPKLSSQHSHGGPLPSVISVPQDLPPSSGLLRHVCVCTHIKIEIIFFVCDVLVSCSCGNKVPQTRVNFKCCELLVSLRWGGQRTALLDPTGCPLPTTAVPPTFKAGSNLDLLPLHLQPSISPLHADPPSSLLPPAASPTLTPSVTRTSLYQRKQTVGSRRFIIY